MADRKNRQEAFKKAVKECKDIIGIPDYLADDIIKWKKQGKSWGEVEDIITRQVGYDKRILSKCRILYNKEKCIF